MLSPEAVHILNESFQDKQPKEILTAVWEEFQQLPISFSGSEDVALIDLASKVTKELDVFTLDTGRLHRETLQFIERVRSHYKTDIEALKPDPAALESLISSKGLYSFYRDGHEECCGIRKVAPLGRKLAQIDVWITGQRRDQSPTRAEVAVIEIDNSFSSADHQVIKVNPLANWTSADVWNYIRMFDVPYNLLHDRGFISIGCEPCTKAVGPHQHEREGRWWWEEATIKECGLHRGNLGKPNS